MSADDATRTTGAAPARVPRHAIPSAADRRLAEIGVLGVMVLWAGNFIVVKSAIGVLPPVGFTFLRFTLVAATLFLLLRWREGSIGLPRRDRFAIMGFGAVGFGVYQILWTTGLQTVPAGDSALIIAATPVLVALVSVVAGTDVLTRPKLAGVLVSFAGVAVVIASGRGLTLGGSLVGEVLTLGATVCWSIYTAYAGPYLWRYSPLRATAWASLAGTLVLAPLGLIQLGTVDVGGLQPAILGAILYSGFLSSGVANVVVMNGVKIVGPTRTAALQFLVPALAVALAAVFLDEPIRPGQIVGGVVIVAGVLLTRWQPRRPSRARA